MTKPDGKPESLWSKYPDYEVALEPNAERVRVYFGGELVADTRAALVVRETRHAPVLYLPRADVHFEHLERTEHSTVCPFKGEASYWSLRAGRDVSENAVWSYEDPFEEVAGLAGYLAFYEDRVEWKREPGEAS